jgi:Transcription factor WhiB
MNLREFVNAVCQRGACVTTSNADAWFREEPRGRAALEVQRRYARRACASCPVRKECLTLALSHEAEAGVSWGIWGGVCARDRQTALQGAKNNGPEEHLDLAGLAESLLVEAEVDIAPIHTQGNDRSGRRAKQNLHSENDDHTQERIAS